MVMLKKDIKFVLIGFITFKCSDRLYTKYFSQFWSSLPPAAAAILAATSNRLVTSL